RLRPCRLLLSVDPLFPVEVPMTFVQLIQGGALFAMRRCRINLYPVGIEARTKVPHARVRGHRAPRKDGTHLPSGVLQPAVVPVTHPTLESVRFSFRRFQAHLLNSPPRHQTRFEIEAERRQPLACVADHGKSAAQSPRVSEHNNTLEA